MYETGIAEWDDIFEGSVVIGQVTGEIKAEARSIIADMERIGYAGAIPWIASRLTAALVRWRQDVESGARPVVGVNMLSGEIGLFTADGASTGNGSAPDTAGGRRRALSEWRAAREQRKVDDGLRKLREVARRGENVLPVSIELAHAGGTTGEWTAALEEVFGGRYQAPLGLDLGDFRPSLTIPAASRPIRVLLAKSGLDGHINAVKLLAIACRQAGMEVVYTGLKQTPEMIVSAAVQEDVDLIGISTLSGSHLWIAERVHELLEKAGRADLPVVMGGIIPDGDRPALASHGVRQVFTPRDGEIGPIIQAMIDTARGR
jgi:(2R)-ethylmalonyl-CoA mutase